MISTAKNYTQSKTIAIPLFTLNKIEVIAEVGQDVMIGTPLLSHSQRSIYSTVSGTISNIIKMRDIEGEQCYHVLIQNDTKNTVEPSIQALSLEELIYRYYTKTTDLESFVFRKQQPIIINTLFIHEPFISLDPKFLTESIDRINEVLTTLNQQWEFSKIYFLVEEGCSIELTTIPQDRVETLIVKPEKDVDYAYKAINKIFKEALIRQHDYQYLNIESIYRLHELITYHRPAVFTRLALSGDAIKQPMLLSVRIGTLFEEIKRIFQGYATTSPITMTVNGLLRNVNVYHDEFAIANSIIALHVQEHREREVYDCISCGRCNDICPVGIFPSKIMHSHKQGIRLDSMRSNLCIECGLCSYTCPSKINVMQYVKDVKAAIRRRKL